MFILDNRRIINKIQGLNFQIKKSPKFFIFTLCLVIFFYGCNDDSKAISPQKKIKSDSKNKYDNEIFDMDINITNKGVVTQKIKAGHVMQTKIKYSNLMRSVIDSGLNVIFYKQGKVSGNLTSKKGIMDDKRGVFTAIGNVVFTSPSGYRVYTEELKWDRKKARIFTDKYVLSVSDQNDTLIGENGMDANQDFTDIIIKSAKGRKKIEKKIK